MFGKGSHSRSSISTGAFFEPEKIQEPLAQTTVIRRRISKLCVENDMYRRFLNKVGEVPEEDHAPIDRRSSRFRSLSMLGKDVVIGRKLKILNAEEKCTIASNAIEEYNRIFRQMTDEFFLAYCEYSASLEGMQAVASEIDRNRSTLNRYVVSLLAHEDKQRAHNAFMHCHRAYLRQLDNSLFSMHQEGILYRGNLRKIKHQLKERESAASHLQPVDMMVLELKCATALAHFQRLRVICLRKKEHLHRCIRGMQSLENSLNSELKLYQKLERETTQRTLTADAVKAETLEAEKSCLPDEYENELLKSLLGYSNAPKIRDFINVWCFQNELSAKMSEAKRKLRIAKMSFARHKKIWNDAQKQAL